MPDTPTTISGADPTGLSITDPFTIFSFLGLVLIFPILGFLLICTARRSANVEWDRVARGRRHWPVRPSLHRTTNATVQDLEARPSTQDAAQYPSRAHRRQSVRPSTPVPIMIEVTAPSSDSQASRISPTFDKLYDGCVPGVLTSDHGQDPMFLPETATDLAPDTGVVHSKGTTRSIPKFWRFSRGYHKLDDEVAGDKPCK